MGSSTSGRPAGAATPPRAGLLARLPLALAVVPLVLISLSVLLCLSVLQGGPAAADTIGGARARASQLAGQIAAEATQVHQLDQRYAGAEDRVAVLDQQLGAARSAMSASQRRMARARADLSRQAVAAYVQAGVPSQLLGLLSQRPTSYAVSQVYLGATAGATTNALDGYRRARRGLAAREAALEAAQRQAAAGAGAILSLRRGLQAQLVQEAVTLAQVKGQLAQLVAQAEAARAARAAAVRLVAEHQASERLAAQLAAEHQASQLAAQQRAAQQLAAQAAAEAATRAPSPSVGPAAPLPQGLPLPAGLQSLSSPPPTPVASGGAWAFAALRQCESGGNYRADTGNGYYGAYQFSAATWHNLGYPGLPSQAPPGEQDQAAARLQAQSGWGQWPTCAAMLGLT